MTMTTLRTWLVDYVRLVSDCLPVPADGSPVCTVRVEVPEGRGATTAQTIAETLIPAGYRVIAVRPA